MRYRLWTKTAMDLYETIEKPVPPMPRCRQWCRQRCKLECLFYVESKGNRYKHRDVGRILWTSARVQNTEVPMALFYNREASWWYRFENHHVADTVSFLYTKVQCRGTILWKAPFPACIKKKQDTRKVRCLYTKENFIGPKTQATNLVRHEQDVFLVQYRRTILWILRHKLAQQKLTTDTSN